MARHLTFLLSLALAATSIAQITPNLEQALRFEGEHKSAMPAGWTGTAAQIAVDDQTVHSGKYSVRLQGASAAGATILTKVLPMEFTGTTLVMRGFLRTDSVNGFAGIWAREDGERPTLEFDNMQNQQLKGTTDWKQYTITLPINAAARQLVFGVLLAGTGTVWADDLELLVDGKPLWEAPKVERPKTILETDKEFDAGSRVTVTELSKAQIANLATLGKVWGFLKYHHPAVVSGKYHWDYELFRILPKVISATDSVAANQAMVAWIDALGPVAPCSPCAKLPDDLQLRPDNGWISDEKSLGGDLSSRLRKIYDNRIPAKQFYVARAAASNPSFEHELPYAQIKSPDVGFQLLALFRFWNVVQYWSPNRDIAGANWQNTLTEFIPRIALAKAPGEYQRQLMAFIALDRDTHANLWGSLDLRPPVGACQLPVTVRFLGRQAVVTGYAADSGRSSGLAPGDVITQLDGIPVNKLIADWTPYYAVSNEAALLRDIGRSLTRGACGEARVGIRRGGEEREMKIARLESRSMDARAGSTHDRPGDTFQVLSPDVAYLKLSSIKAADLPRYIDSAASAKGLIIDIRNYPSEFVVFALGNLLAKVETRFVRFTQYDLDNPGAFRWLDGPALTPAKPHYAGKVIVLVDEVSQSQAEYTTMAFRAAGATVIGSMTAGADGNVSQFSLPGGLSTMISGLGVFYPDGKPTQQVGIVPDVEVKPTIEAIRAGRDELLEEAIRRIR